MWTQLSPSRAHTGQHNELHLHSMFLYFPVVSSCSCVRIRLHDPHICNHFLQLSFVLLGDFFFHWSSKVITFLWRLVRVQQQLNPCIINVPRVYTDINWSDMPRLGKYFTEATAQHLPLIGAILRGALAMCSVPSQIVPISKILRSRGWMLRQSWADELRVRLVSLLQFQISVHWKHHRCKSQANVGNKVNKTWAVHCVCAVTKYIESCSCILGLEAFWNKLSLCVSTIIHYQVLHMGLFICFVWCFSFTHLTAREPLTKNQCVYCVPGYKIFRIFNCICNLHVIVEKKILKTQKFKMFNLAIMAQPASIWHLMILPF